MTETTMPDCYAIALWWSKHQREDDVCFVVDLNEPSCFGCGWYPGWNSKGGPDIDRLPARKAWANAKLERCHLVADSLGGSAEASNLALLCYRCHTQSPDVADRTAAIRWISQRPNFMRIALDQLLGEITRTATAAEIESLQALAYVDTDEMRKRIETAGEGWVTTHLGASRSGDAFMHSTSTIAHLLIRAATTPE